MKINKLTSFHLKIIAMLTMVIDHIGVFLFPDILIFRLIGRISFPLYAFLCAEAMHYGSHKKRYISILISFDIVISLLIYFITKENQGSVFSCLAIGSITILLLQNPKKWIKCLAIIPIMYAIYASLRFTHITIQYGIYGVLLIVGFYMIRVFLNNYFNNKVGNNINDFNFDLYYAIICSIYLLSISLVIYNFHDFFETYLANNNMDYSYQSNAILACPFILLYSGKKGYSSKWFKIFSYSFYPLHILIILLIKIILQIN